MAAESNRQLSISSVYYIREHMQQEERKVHKQSQHLSEYGYTFGTRGNPACFCCTIRVCVKNKVRENEI